MTVDYTGLFGIKVKQARHLRNWTVKKLQKKMKTAGFTPEPMETMSRIEGGKYIPKENERIACLCMTLGLPIAKTLRDIAKEEKSIYGDKIDINRSWPGEDE